MDRYTVKMNIDTAIQINKIKFVEQYVKTKEYSELCKKSNSLGGQCVTDNRLEILKLLVDNGYDINSRSEFDITTLGSATFLGKIEMMKYIMSIPNCDINIRYCHTNMTPILNLCYTNNIKSFKKRMEMVSLIIKKGADIYIKSITKNSVHNLLIGKYPKREQEIRSIIGNALCQRSLIDYCVYYIKQNKQNKQFNVKELKNLNRDIRKQFNLAKFS